MPEWIKTKIKDLTVEDAIKAYGYGVNFICGDGKLRQITTEPNAELLDILSGKEV